MTEFRGAQDAVCGRAGKHDTPAGGGDEQGGAVFASPAFADVASAELYAYEVEQLRTRNQMLSAELQGVMRELSSCKQRVVELEGERAPVNGVYSAGCCLAHLAAHPTGDMSIVGTRSGSSCANDDDDDEQNRPSAGGLNTPLLQAQPPPPPPPPTPQQLEQEQVLSQQQQQQQQLVQKGGSSSRKRRPAERIAGQSRYWTPEEHELFLQAMKRFGHKDLRSISQFVGTRNVTQVRTHIQKYFMKLLREAKRRQESELGEGLMSPVLGPVVSNVSSPENLELGDGDKEGLQHAQDVRSVPESCGVSLLSMVITM